MFTVVAEWIGTFIEAVGVAIIVAGAVIPTWRFLRDWTATRSFEDPYQAYRGNLGRAILLGLEFLVAADIVGGRASLPRRRRSPSRLRVAPL